MPSQFDEAKDAASAFRKSLKHVNQLMANGASLSGHERNCLFLNEHNGRFATISGVSGFDFADDARAVATVDWDSDGDLDIWTTNRTAPRVRFLRNDTPSNYRFLKLRLKGTTCNHDAIGARVTVNCKGAHPVLVKTLRAGEGYLAQSSKWLVFGLGHADAVNSVDVRWPDGKLQRFLNLQTDSAYRLVQGADVAQLIERRREPVACNTARQPVPPATDRARILLTDRIPVSRLEYLSIDGSEMRDVDFSRVPLLLNLWASWCTPCLAELGEMRRQHDRIKQAGLNVLALSVDSQLKDSRSESDMVSVVVDKVGFPFPHGRATDELIRRLQVMHEMPFSGDVSLPMPTSFLIDSQRRVSAIYRGPVVMEQLLDDVKRLSESEQTWQDAALPFAGRWNERGRSSGYLAIARDLLEHGQVEDAHRFVSDNSASLESDAEFAKLLTWLADDLIGHGRTVDALKWYERALTEEPNNLLVLNNVAWQLATHPDPRVRNGQRAVHWAELAARQTRFHEPNVLATLAASYAEAGRFSDAVSTTLIAIRLARGTGQSELAGKLESRLALFKSKLPFRSQ